MRSKAALCVTSAREKRIYRAFVTHSNVAPRHTAFGGVRCFCATILTRRLQGSETGGTEYRLGVGKLAAVAQCLPIVSIGNFRHDRGAQCFIVAE